MASFPTQARRRIVTTRVIRSGETELPDQDWAGTTPSDRIAAVWELTRQCLAWNRETDDEPRLQRSVSRIQRTWLEQKKD